MELEHLHGIYPQRLQIRPDTSLLAIDLQWMYGTVGINSGEINYYTITPIINIDVKLNIVGITSTNHPENYLSSFHLHVFYVKAYTTTTALPYYILLIGY